MKILFWAGLVVLVLGIVSLLVPIPRNERHGIDVGPISGSIETRHDEKVPLAVSGILLAGGIGMMIAGARSRG